MALGSVLMGEDPAEVLKRNRALLRAHKETEESEHLLEKLPQGHGSGLNADMVDGLHAAEIIARAPGKGGGGGGSGSGSGDMTKAVYDQNDNGVVDNSEKLEGSTKVQVQDHAPKSHANEAHSTQMATALQLAIHEADPDIHHAQVHTLASHLSKAHSELTGVTADQHHAQLHKDTHKSGGADAFASTDLLEAIVKRLQESSGPSNLLLGSIADGEYLKRSGTDIIGGTPSGGGTPESIFFGAYFMAFSGLDVYSVGGSSGYTFTKYSWGGYMATPSVLNNYVWGHYRAGGYNWVNFYSADSLFELILYLSSSDADLSTSDFWIYVGSGGGSPDTTVKYGIHIYQGNLRLVTSDGTTQSESANLMALSKGTQYRVKVKFTAGSQVEVWVNGVSKGTKNTNLPTGNLTAAYGLPCLFAKALDDISAILSYMDLKVMRTY
jgi:hypothetical protein